MLGIGCALLLALAAPATANAAMVGVRWPGKTITYFDGSRDKAAVARAVAAWNRSGVGIRFVRTYSRTRAQLVIRNTRAVPGGCGTGYATLGYPGRGRQAQLGILHAASPRDQGCAWPGQTLVVAHELGHVLGLGHVDSRCSLMNSSHVGGVAPRRCYGGWSMENVLERTATWRCRILEPADVRAVLRRYGGTRRPVRANPWCDLFRRLDAPSGLAATWDADAQRVNLQLVRPATKPVPSFLAARAAMPHAFEIYRAKGACVTSHRGFAQPSTDVIYRPWSAVVGAAETVMETQLEAGSWCWSAWARDALGKPSAGPVTATLEVPAVATEEWPGEGFASPRRAGKLPAAPARPPITRFDDH